MTDRELFLATLKILDKAKLVSTPIMNSPKRITLEFQTKDWLHMTKAIVERLAQPDIPNNMPIANLKEDELMYSTQPDEAMIKRVMDGIPDMPIKVQDEREANYKSFAQSAQVNGIPEAYTPAKGGLLPKRNPSGSWTSWDNTMCNPLADARMQTQSAWADGYASAKAEWVGLTDKEVEKIFCTHGVMSPSGWALPHGMAREIEAKLREKNG